MKTLLFYIAVSGFSMSALGGILNGSFEVYEPNASDWIMPPVDWQYENYAGVHTEFTPSPEPGNSKGYLVNWSIPGAVDGDYFCLLSTGDMGDRSDAQITISTIQQQITLVPGETLYGSYFFGTCDWWPFLDEATITLSAVDPNDDPNFVTLVNINVDDVGDCGAMDGWQGIYYVFPGLQATDYYLTCQVRDIGDTILKSYLAVDDFQICPISRYDGDLNFDCRINLDDFEILSEAWLANCSDPNTFADPNTPCGLADIDGNDYVDSGDLLYMSGNWLFPTP